MEHLLQWFAHRFRPRVGWRLLLLALAAALCPAIAAADSPLNLPAAPIGWAGLLGLLLGMRGPRHENRETEHRTQNTEHRTQNTEQEATHHASRITHHASRITHHVSRFTFYVLRFTLWIGLGAFFLLLVLGALPPLGLWFQDLAALWDWLGRLVRRGLGVGAPPASRAWVFFGEALPRAWRDLMAAPAAGERGARLLVASGGVASVWLGALALGWGVARGRAALGWSLPLLAALALTTMLGGGSALPLIGGLSLLLLLAMATDFRSREAAWARAGVDFSDELWQDVLMWGGAAAAAIVVLAALLPAWLENPLADALWRDVEPPSGLAVLDRNIQRSQRGPPKVDPGISKLPGLELGMSLEEQPPETVALRVRLGAPLPDSPWPHYWRARVFNIYTGRGWTQNARVSPLDPIEPRADAFPGAILQEIEDARADRGIIFAIPDAIAVSVPANVERLPDGDQAALTLRAVGADQRIRTYRVLSRPQELAEPPPPSAPPPDLSGYLLLPQNLPPQVGETARAATRESAGSYEQALALEQFLRELPYSYQVQPLPGDGDAVYQFLFQMRRGYCTYYASAMAVLARSLGIPARVAIGFATGEYDQSSGVYVVREADAHAWPELYIGGRWLPFEPTPIRPLPARTTRAEPTPVPQPAAQEQPSTGRGPLIWLAVLLGLSLLTAAGIWRRRRPTPAPLVAQVQLRLERSGARAGVPWPPGATLHEYGALLDPRLDGASGALREVVELIERVRYGRRELQADEERRLRAAEAQVLAQLRRGERRA